MAKKESKSDSIVIEREGTSGTTNLFVHPLVIMNISDHYTRERVKVGPKSNPRCIGVLLGIQKGRDVEIYQSFPVPYEDKKKRWYYNQCRTHHLKQKLILR